MRRFCLNRTGQMLIKVRLEAGTGYHTSDSRCHASDSCYHTSDSRYPISDSRYPTSDSSYHTSDNRRHTPDSRYPISDNRHHTSDSGRQELRKTARDGLASALAKMRLGRDFGLFYHYNNCFLNPPSAGEALYPRGKGKNSEDSRGKKNDV